MAGSMTWQEAFEHVPHETCEAEERAKQAMPHYILTEGNEKNRIGYCTACERWVECGKEQMQRIPGWVRNDPYLDGGDQEYPFIPFTLMREEEFQRRNSGRTRHNDTGYCPECGERVTFKSIGRGIKNLYHRRFFFRWVKSRKSPKDTLVGLGYDVVTSFRYFDAYNAGVPMDMELREICVIRWGHGGDRFIKDLQWCGVGGWEWKWAHRKECKSGWVPGSGVYSNGVQTVLDNESFYEAVQGTPWAKVMASIDVFGLCETANYYDRITILKRMAQYPCVEYMAILGYESLAAAVIDGSTHGVLNLRGKTARSVLRLTQDEWGEVKGKKLNVTVGLLEAKRYCREHKIHMNMELCGELTKRGYWKETVKEIFEIDPSADLVKAVKYCRKKGIRIHAWRDQLSLMQRLDMNLNDKEWRYPKDFDRAHHVLSERWHELYAEKEAKRKDAEQAGKNAKIRARLDSGELDEYFFSANGLVLRPMMSVAEVIREGSAQKHCVARYAETYAEGNDVLCTLRLEKAMDVPLYTVEFGKDGKLVQCRAKSNSEGPLTRAERERFWKLHDLMRTDLKKQKAKAERAKKRKETAA